MTKPPKRRPIPSSYIFLGLLALFILSRIFIWIFRPADFTEIIYSYMPYAHLWASGVQPYLEQWYEYPPATIPLFFIPHMIDIGSLKSVFHLDYLQAYRGLILLIDIGMFALLWKALKKTQSTVVQRVVSVVYLIAATAKAHHFIYDSIDWVFAGTLLLAATAPLVFSKKLGAFASWIGYWLGVAVKLINGPLGATYALLEPKRLKQTAFWIAITGLLVWGVPLALYRSSLQVILVFHSMRGLQIDSVGAVLARVIDRFTQTESVIEIYKNYEITGPVSSVILTLVEKSLPIALAVFVLFSWYLIAKTSEKKRDLLRVHLTLGYILVFMIFSKVLSTPFLLWHIPLLAVYPFARIQTQRILQFSSFLLIVICMSPLPFINWNGIHLPTWIHVTKSIILISWLVWWVRQSLRMTRDTNAI